MERISEARNDELIREIQLMYSPHMKHVSEAEDSRDEESSRARPFTPVVMETELDSSVYKVHNLVLP